MKTWSVSAQKKVFIMPPFAKNHLALPHFFQYTILLWTLFGIIILMILPIFLIAKLCKLARHFLEAK
jgi:hypothetical protein